MKRKKIFVHRRRKETLRRSCYFFFFFFFSELEKQGRRTVVARKEQGKLLETRTSLSFSLEGWYITVQNGVNAAAAVLPFEQQIRKKGLKRKF